jgi:hypothetical protein
MKLYVRKNNLSILSHEIPALSAKYGVCPKASITLKIAKSGFMLRKIFALVVWYEDENNAIKEVNTYEFYSFYRTIMGDLIS